MNSEQKKVFCRETRLRKKIEFDYLRSTGTREAGKYLVMVYASPPDGQRKVGVVNSRRYSRKAVERNRARRLIKESYRLLLPHIKDAWLLFIPRHRIMEAKMPEVCEDMQKVLRRSNQLVCSSQEIWVKG